MLKFRTMTVDADQSAHQAYVARTMNGEQHRGRRRALQARPRDRRNQDRALAAQDEPRRAAAAHQRPAAARCRSWGRGRAWPTRRSYFAAAPLRALPRSARDHRPVAGDRTCACELRRGARDGRRLRPQLVARSRSVPAPPHPGRGAAPAEGDGLMASLDRRTIRPYVPDVVSARQPEAETAPVRVGVVGLGYWGPNLVRVLNELSHGGGRLDVRSAAGARSKRSAGASRPSARRRTSTRCSTTTAWMRSPWSRRSPPTTTWRCGR